MARLRGLFPQERDKVFNSQFGLEKNAFQGLRGQISSVTRDYHVKMRLGVVAQISMATGLVVEVETCTQEHTQEFLGRDSRQFWHQRLCRVTNAT